MRKTFGAFVVAGMVLAGVGFGGGGSAQAFCPPGGSGLSGGAGGNFPALVDEVFPAGFPGPWNATSGGGGASDGKSAVEITCGDGKANGHGADRRPGPHS
jgi:hypothetical protein